MNEDLLQLLTAAIDGELTPDEQWAVHGLLCESEEARTIFSQMQSDSIRLKALSKAPPADLVSRILSRLPSVEPAPRPSDPHRSRRRIVASLAASVLLAIGFGSFLYSRKPGSDAVPNGPLTAHATDPQLVNVLPKESGPQSLPPVPPIPPERNVAELNPAPPVPPAPDRVDEIPPPREKGADVFVAPPLKPISPLDRFIVRLPLLISVSDLEREDARQRLLAELSRESAYRIDLFAKDTAKAVEAVQAAAKASNIALFADSQVADRLKRRQTTSVVVYAESLGAADIRDLLVKLSADDAKNTQRVFDSLHATPAAAADATALKDVLGTDPGLWKRPAAEPKPISANTGDELTKNLTAKPGEHPAVLLTLTPAASRTPPAMSKELKEFLARRGERKASAVPILIVIRPPAGG
jgi:hypothetical protein